MKRMIFCFTIIIAAAAVISFTTDCEAMFSFGLHRDCAFLTALSEAQCQFPPLLNPCQVPCRPPGLQKQAVPCAFQTACPSLTLPAHGVSYGWNPYPLFGMR
ncbi:MAG: hypothetical protein RDU20_15985 [Desulfomonilaceae bacterium]|nr:hypothetical protein [Desulfomonilaceae bacterium]